MITQSAERTSKNVDKVSRYGWTMQDKSGRLMLLPKLDLKVDPSYQRVNRDGGALHEDKVLEIARNWSWISFGALTVAEREGVYFVCDGWHRVNAALRRSDVHMLPCIVFKTFDKTEEAKAFVDVNTGRKAVTALAKYRASVVSGDPTALWLESIAQELGLEFSANSNKPSHVRAVAWCMGIAADEKNRSDLISVLTVAADLSRSANIPVHDRILNGLWYISRNCEGGLSDKRLLKRLQEVGARRLLDAAAEAAAYFAAGGAKVWARGMLKELNKRLHNKFRFKDGSEE
jgi:hypothetical protein